MQSRKWTLESGILNLEFRASPRPVTPSPFEQLVKLLLGFVSLGVGAAGAGQQGWIGTKVIAVVGGLLLADPVGLGFRALAVFAGIVELAIAAGVQVGVAPGAGVARGDAASGGILDSLSAFPAIEEHSA